MRSIIGDRSTTSGSASAKAYVEGHVEARPYANDRRTTDADSRAWIVVDVRITCQHGELYRRNAYAPLSTDIVLKTAPLAVHVPYRLTGKLVVERPDYVAVIVGLQLV